MGYSTTTDKEEAVTDLAVMNERGNYSEGEYKRILEAQKKMYTDMVSDMKCMLDEYRANVIDGAPLLCLRHRQDHLARSHGKARTLQKTRETGIIKRLLRSAQESFLKGNLQHS